MIDYNPNNRHTIAFDVIIKTLAPLSHIGESVGNQSNLKTLKITDIDGESQEVFVYSGNALRNGLLRRRGMKSFLEQVGLQVKPEIHQLLFAGGYIDGSTGCDLELDAKVRSLLPPLSVLGGSKPKDLFGSKNCQMLPGRINVGDGYLVCYETAEYILNGFRPCLPAETIKPLEEIVKLKKNYEDKNIDAWLNGEEIDLSVEYTQYRKKLNYYREFLEDKLRHYPEWLTWNQKVRMDSLKSADLQPFLEGAEPKEGQLTLLGDAQEKSSKKKADKKTTQQMIMGDWLLQAGATLYSRWNAEITNIEEGFIADAFLEFAKNPYLGGKSNTGCGLVQIDVYYRTSDSHGRWLQVNPNSQVLSDRCQSQYQQYQQYLQEYRDLLADIKQGGQLKGFLGA